ncbi:signal transduction protein with CBS domains [Haloterrigena salina JCM 13891]|uniref:Signal transduction protein with CBS domains n=1 Tax=Haloterrigena salina JCM 13891 TaxID=1227488 RepID=M0CGH7_9EURY|nr:CBS domain-containing protein [Haloterrigena salina]ELZ21738.1 signal transduction protein with CBS domains [Haloterrigena salina JCM 13891]
MSVGELGPKNVVTAGPDTELETVAQRLASNNVGAAVVTEGEEPVGIVTDRDIALEVAQSDDVAATPAEDVMTAGLTTLREDADAIEISRAIKEENARRFPVVDENGELTGIVTLDDLVATIGEQLDNVADTIEAQSPAYSP